LLFVRRILGDKQFAKNQYKSTKDKLNLEINYWVHRWNG